MEASSSKRETYEEIIKSIPKDLLVYIDESGIEMGTCKEHGWSKIGEAIPAQRSGKTYRRLNIIAALNEKKVMAPFTFYGSCDTTVFNLWVQKVLVPELKPGQVVILDNATFHKSNQTEKLIKKAECQLIFLPPYSPDLNPIEKFWAKMKKWIRNQWINFQGLYSALQMFFAI